MKFGVRGQSALEYLMTYGWALVVIVIAVAALVILINPSNIQGDTCDSKLGPFVITQSNISADSAQLVLVNQTGQGVSAMDFNVTGTHGGANAYTSGAVTESPTSMTAGETATFTVDPANDLNAGTYNLTYSLTYSAGNLTGLTATAQCRGTI
ncbi:MAG: hypothetical protein IPJ89_01105 [Candidatus Iainarchaeum archaeon]|uniref:Class III signal peptide-containing protein n=1 Tax=Candidatus Iainarchaeum sp. TaxID=3101447 RepID=A0A7T9I1W1_9ARCH|nr:MAG: hypothetical protein IPJ89_01105 [Candidatus Diapherotrites archaeon]